MANKKRRKPSNKPRAAQTDVRTAERPEARERSAAATDRAARNGNGHATTAAPRSAARAEKKDIARRQREEVRKIIRRRQRVRRGAWIVGITVAVVAGVLWFTRPDGEPVATNALPGLLRTEAPWPANADLALERADAINLPAHGSNLAMHEHVNLQIFVHGTPEQVPVNVGINDRGAASLHTHTSDGLVHIESGTVADFTLGQFFDVWGVRYTPRCLGAYCSDGTNELQVFVDGQPYTGGDITQVPLDPESVIVVTYGTQDELPDPIPSTFDFNSIAA
jgi:hypothetical protein